MIFSNEELEFFNNKVIFSGSDEAGRGCLAGPVVGASVILNLNFDGKLINDSKKLNPKNREEAYNYIIENCLTYAYKFIDNNEIEFLKFKGVTGEERRNISIKKSKV